MAIAPSVFRPTFIPWDQFLANEFDWRQGEHITLIGPTGRGKTTLARAILPRRRYVAVIATKPRDELLSQFREDGYEVIRRWPPPTPLINPRVCFWPRIASPSDIPAQKEAIRIALVDMYRSGGWTIYFDELNYLTQFLRLSPLVELLWRQGRSLGVSVVGGTQRPFHVPLLAYDQATHLFFWQDSDVVNLKRLAGMGGAVPTKTVLSAVASLEGHSCLYLNTRTGRVALTRVEVGGRS